MKAILVLKDMPKTCGDCELSSFFDEDDMEEEYMNCPAHLSKIDEEPAMYNTKPNWCPLKPLPKRKAMGGLDIVGWNQCLDEILDEHYADDIVYVGEEK